MTLQQYADRCRKRATEAQLTGATLRGADVWEMVAQEVTELTAPVAKANEEDMLVALDVAMHRLGVSRRWLRDHAKTLPFLAKVGRRLRVSTKALEEYIRGARKAP